MDRVNNNSDVARTIGGLIDAWALANEDNCYDLMRPHVGALLNLADQGILYAPKEDPAVTEAKRQFLDAAFVAIFVRNEYGPDAVNGMEAPPPVMEKYESLRAKYQQVDNDG